MDQPADTNAAIWQSEEIVRAWTAESDQREQNRAAQRRLMALLLPFGEQEAFTFLDLGAGTGAASRVILGLYPRSTAILADFSSEMMSAGDQAMLPFADATGMSTSTCRRASGPRRSRRRSMPW